MLADLIFTTPRMEALFSDAAELQVMLAVESALATAQATVGAIPPEAARIIADVCGQTDWDTEPIRQQTLLAGNPAIPMVRMLQKRVGQNNPEMVQYVHRGATSQDIIDTALMSQLKQALAQFQADLGLLNGQLTTLAHTHRQTPMMGRTLLQQAIPITFGDKVTGWLDGLLRSEERLSRVMAECLVVQVGGPVGNGASFGNQAVWHSDAGCGFAISGNNDAELAYTTGPAGRYSRHTRHTEWVAGQIGQRYYSADADRSGRSAGRSRCG